MSRAGRSAVPAAVTAAFVVAVVAGPLLPRSGGLPGAALGTTWLLYGLRTLELSMRGARYAEASGEQRFGPLEARLAELETEIGAFAIAAADTEPRLAALEQTRRHPNPRR